MKIIEIHTEENREFACFRPDTAMLRNNDNFYIPYEAGDISCRFGFAAMITSQAKFVEKRFAGKYYEKVGCVIAFTNDSLIARRKRDDLPYEEAYSFDHSIAVSPVFAETERMEGHDGVLRIGRTAISLATYGIRDKIDASVSMASHSATLRTGDLVCWMALEKFIVAKGTRIELSFGKELPQFEFEVR